jgi:hypothetical protein
MQHATFNTAFDQSAYGAGNSARDTGDSERNRFAGERKTGTVADNSLVAFLRAIKFARGTRNTSIQGSERGFAQPHPQARQPKSTADESDFIRSAN